MFMMELFVAFILALFFTFLLVIIFGWRSTNRTEARTAFPFLFFLLLLMIWAGGGWLQPFGPLAWGVAWLPYVVVGIIMMFVILSLVPPRKPRTRREALAQADARDSTDSLISAFFWILIIFLIVALITHYM